MSRIKILSEHLANQIAAGEVIERPASVVKELLENAIDAGARRISIEIGGDGTRLIRVIDDGTGMDGDDALLCLERHATSKLGNDGTAEGRLAAIRSLGFRGEAIPSIGSVAKMTITTRTEMDSLGTRVEIRYGKMLKIHEIGCSKGTVMEVRDLFGNMPARKKFLKSTRTELFHIEEIVKNYALANSGLGFTFVVDGKAIYDFAAGTDTLADRVGRLYAMADSTSLISLADRGDTLSGARDGETGISGFLLPPEHSAGASARLRLFVNGRAVKDRMLAHAVGEGLSGFLMKGRTPAGVLFVTVPYETVDVNVHPTKQEIRFQQPNRIHAAVVAAVRHAMGAFQQASRRKIFGRPEPGERSPFDRSLPQARKKGGFKSIHKLWDEATETGRQKASPTGTVPFGPETVAPQEQNRQGLTSAEPAAPFASGDSTTDLAPESLKPIGQFMDLYLLCEARRNNESFLVVIDQHAVHERILFENLKLQYGAGQMQSQNLLFPKMIELAPDVAETLAGNREELERFGLVIEAFGSDTYVLKAVPAILSHLDPEEILAGILQGFSGSGSGRNEGRKASDATRLEDILSDMACKAAIKAGRHLDASEIRELLRQMQESRAFTHCPHGRPVVRLFSEADVKKWFHRT